MSPKGIENVAGYFLNVKRLTAPKIEYAIYRAVENFSNSTRDIINIDVFPFYAFHRYHKRVSQKCIAEES